MPCSLVHLAHAQSHQHSHLPGPPPCESMRPSSNDSERSISCLTIQKDQFAASFSPNRTYLVACSKSGVITRIHLWVARLSVALI